MRLFWQIVILVLQLGGLYLLIASFAPCTLLSRPDCGDPLVDEIILLYGSVSILFAHALLTTQRQK